MTGLALLFFVFIALCPALAHAQDPLAYTTGASLTPLPPITSTTNGVQLIDKIRKGVTIASLPTSTAVLYIARVQGTCETTMTAPVGDPVYPGGSYTALVTDGWAGQLCGILESAGTVNPTRGKW